MIDEDTFGRWLIILIPAAILLLGIVYLAQHHTINVVEFKDGSVHHCELVRCYLRGSCHISGCGDGVEYIVDEYKILDRYVK